VEVLYFSKSYLFVQSC